MYVILKEDFLKFDRYRDTYFNSLSLLFIFTVLVNNTKMFSTSLFHESNVEEYFYKSHYTCRVIYMNFYVEVELGDCGAKLLASNWVIAFQVSLH